MVDYIIESIAPPSEEQINNVPSWMGNNSRKVRSEINMGANEAEAETKEEF